MKKEIKNRKQEIGTPNFKFQNFNHTSILYTKIFNTLNTMKNSLTLLVVMIVFTASSFAKGENYARATETRNPASFYGIVVASDVNVVFTQESEQSVRVEAPKSDLSYVNTKVINGSLVISVRNNYKLHGPVTVYVSTSEVNLVEVIGNGSISSTNMINADMLTLKLKGNGTINIDVRALSVGMNLSGSGTINISGSAANSLIKIYGQGHIYAGHFSSFKTVEMIDGVVVDMSPLKS
jgi:hypothetical protein